VAANSRRRARRQAMAALILAFIVVMVSILVYSWVHRSRATTDMRTPRIGSVAVLPFENLSGDPAQEDFADGMTDELTTNLGKLTALRVISRTSAMRYKGSRKPLPEIARELNVDAIVEGSVQRSGNHVHASARLLYAPADRQLWACIYESELGDVLILQ